VVSVSGMEMMDGWMAGWVGLEGISRVGFQA
jgi:hypothetical protein